MERGVYIRQGSVVTEPSAVKFASSQQVENVEVSIVQGLVINSCSLCFGCGSEQGGPATCSGACVCSARCWIKYDTPAVTVYSVNACGNRNSGACEGQESAQEAPATVNRQTRGNLFGAFDSCVLFSLVFGGFLDLCEQRVLLAVGTCRVRLLHRITVLTPTQECHYGLSSLASEAPLASSQSSSKTEVRQSDSKGSANT